MKALNLYRQEERKKQVVLLVTHFYDKKSIWNKYCRLKMELNPEKYDVILLYNVENKLDAFRVPKKIQMFICDLSDINELGYRPIRETMIPGSCHFPLLKFYRENPMYSYYWFIEYDVDFSSQWNMLLDVFYDSDDDFISSHIELYDKQKNFLWCWWHVSNHVGYSIEKCVKAFNPIFRISNSALSYMDCYQLKGFYAHEEVIISTCLYNAGFKLRDFGGTGMFVPKGFENRFYVKEDGINNGTMRYRPLYIKELLNNMISGKLYHPIK